MAFDGIALHAVKQELESLLANSRVDRVYQPEKEIIILKLRSRSGNHNLLLSCKADAARIHLIDEKPENPKQPPVFCMVLRKHLEGGRLVSIKQQGLERVLTFGFQSINEAGSLKNLALHCEIMGKHSNIVLVEADTNSILDGAKRFSHDLNRYREILPGIPYVLPPGQNKNSLTSLTEDEFFTLVLLEPLDKHLNKILLNLIEGFGPLICQEAVIRAGLPKDIVLNQCGEYELVKLWQELSKLAGDIAAGRFKPTLVHENNKYIEFYPFDLELYERSCKEYFNHFNDALNVFFKAKERSIRFNETKQRLDRVINSELKKAKSKLDIQERDLLEASNAENDRISGELITANMHAVSRGDKELNTINYYDPGQANIVIPLDPSLAPSQNAQRYFKKYRKAAVKKEKAAFYITRTKEELLYLDNVSLTIAQAGSMEELEEIQEELMQQGYIKGEKVKAPAYKSPEYLVFWSSDGVRIMAGKNNRQNDFLTMKIAKEEDIWLHAKEIPGAHVIVRTEGKPVPDSTLFEAAIIAAYYSKGKMSGNVPVDYTLRAHVRKPKGAKPGLVIYDNHSTIFVTPDEKVVVGLQVNLPVAD